MQVLGINDGDIVVAYDDQGGVIAARLVWMLRTTGRRAAILDGGLTAYLQAHPDSLTADEPVLAQGDFSTRPWLVNALRRSRTSMTRRLGHRGPFSSACSGTGTWTGWAWLGSSSTSLALFTRTDSTST